MSSAFLAPYLSKNTRKLSERAPQSVANISCSTSRSVSITLPPTNPLPRAGMMLVCLRPNESYTIRSLFDFATAIQCDPDWFDLSRFSIAYGVRLLSFGILSEGYTPWNFAPKSFVPALSSCCRYVVLPPTIFLTERSIVLYFHAHHLGDSRLGAWDEIGAACVLRNHPYPLDNQFGWQFDLDKMVGPTHFIQMYSRP